LKHIIKEDILLLDFLKKIYPDSSNKTLRDLLKHKRIQIDDKTQVNASLLLKKNQTLEISDLVKKITKNINILYEDKDLIIINKKDNFLSAPKDHKVEENALSTLKKNYKKIYLVHRLDKSTSGVMVFAKNLKTKSLLDEMFKKREIKKEYIAIVDGIITKKKDILINNLTYHKDFLVKVSFDKTKGYKAITEYELIKTTKSFSFLKINLITGKKHQIRVQLSHINHPVLGDKKYSENLINPINRLALHSYNLEFIHPITNKKISIKAPIPKSFIALGY
jgi:23S rRNA pseudouridine1911/1915/1917 synthase